MTRAEMGRLQVLADVERGARLAGGTTLDGYLVADGLAEVDGSRLRLTVDGRLELMGLRTTLEEEWSEPSWWAYLEHETWTELLLGPVTKREAIAWAAAHNDMLDAEAAQ